LIKDFGVGKIVEILKILLDARIFESELRAKIDFPKLFRSSPVREVQRTRSENDAIRSDAFSLVYFRGDAVNQKWGSCMQV
jgi:hypothetical protein